VEKNAATQIIAARRNLERLETFRLRRERNLICDTAMPKAFAFQGQRLPASLCKFPDCEWAVLVPTFRQKRCDAEACEIIGACFPAVKWCRSTATLIWTRNASLHFPAAAALGAAPK